MVSVPTDIAFTSPVLALMVATEGLLLLHEPPAEVDEKFAVAPTHKFWFPLNIPAIAGELTIMTIVSAAGGHAPVP